MIRFNKKSLYEFLKNHHVYVSRGTKGLVYKYDQNNLIKVDRSLSGYALGYNEYLNCIERLISLRKELSGYESDQKLLMDKQKNVSNTLFAHNLVYLDDIYIGVLVHFFDGYSDFDKYTFKSSDEFFSVARHVINSNKELMDNGIYHMDLTSGNVLVKNGSSQIIDTDGPGIKFSNSHSLTFEKRSYSLFMEELMSRVYFLKDDEKNDIFQYLILQQVRNKCNYDDTCRFVDEIEKAKVLKI